MPVFGSFSLLLALALSAYCLLAGALALRQLARPGHTRISPEPRSLGALLLSNATSSKSLELSVSAFFLGLGAGRVPLRDGGFSPSSARV